MDKVYCPWCREAIEIRVCDAEGNIPLNQDAYKKDPWAGLFYCLYHPDKMDHPCPIATFRDEPLGKNLYDSEDEAYAAAIRRPLQKPLTLEEACDDENLCVFLEIKDEPDIYVSLLKPDFSIDLCGIDIFLDEEGKCYCLSTYGKYWRCWATKPTQEEREAAKWE